VKRRVALYFVSFFLFPFLLVADNVTAQTIGYRQTNLASNVSNVANSVTPDLVDPWGIAFLSDQPFFLADNKVGRVTVHNASGRGALPDPAVITPTNGAASTMLTVATSANVLHFGLLMPDLIGSWILAAMMLLSLAMWRTRSLPYARLSQLAAVVAAILMLGLAISGCGGYANSSQVNRGTATINVLTQSGAVSHTTTVSVTVQ